jgi:hypothetical protein
MTGPTDTQIHSFLAHHGRELPLVHWPRVMGWGVAIAISAAAWVAILEIVG